MRSHGVAADSVDRHKVAITAESPRRNAVGAGALPSLAVADDRRSAEKTPLLPRGSLSLSVAPLRSPSSVSSSSEFMASCMFSWPGHAFMLADG
jgi:hypothetical protein